MASTIRCDIVSAEAEIYSGEATLVVATVYAECRAGYRTSGPEALRQAGR